MNGNPGPYKAHTSLTRRLAVLALATVFTAGPLALSDALFPPAQAQVEGCDFLLNECAFDLTLEWNETGEPGAILNGTLTIENTGSGSDSYAVTTEADNDNWTAEVDPEETDAVEEGASTEVSVLVLIPEEAHLDDSTTISLTVQSDNDEEASETITFDATAGQVYSWTFVCTQELTIEKNSEETIMLSATNAGNGPDDATISHAPMPEGFEIQEPAGVSLGSGEQEDQNITLGVGIGPEEDDYEIQWTLQSAGDSNTTESCTTMVTVAGVGEGGGDDVDTPGPALVLLLTSIALALIVRRRKAAP